MLNIMVDLESFGLDDDAVLTQIAMVAFDEEYQTIEIFNKTVSVVDSLLDGFSITPSTLEFWRNELKKNDWDESVVQDLFHSKLKPAQVAREVHRWIEKVTEGKQFVIWANGMLFDIPKIDKFLERYGFKSMTDRTRYSNTRDLRTLRLVTKAINKDGLAKVEDMLRAKYSGHVHNAVYDCLYQIELTQACMSILQTTNHFNTKGQTSEEVSGDNT